MSACDPDISLLEQGIIEGENPVFDLEFCRVRRAFEESRYLGV
jgi:hypothetical protein